MNAGEWVNEYALNRHRKMPTFGMLYLPRLLAMRRTSAVCAATLNGVSINSSWFVSRKSGDHDAMKREMTLAMKRASRSAREIEDYIPKKKAALPAWIAA